MRLIPDFFILERNGERSYLLVSWCCNRWSKVSERGGLLTPVIWTLSLSESSSFVSLTGTEMLRGGNTGGIGKESVAKTRYAHTMT